MIKCPYCSREFKGIKLNARHLSKCNPSLKTKPKPCLCGHDSTSLTQMKRHRRVCEVWQSRDVKALANARRKETSLERYGVEDARRTDKANAKRTDTNLDRYGGNPFQSEEIKSKIRGTNRERYGVENVVLCPQVKAKIAATNKGRYGSANPFGSRDVQEKIRSTMVSKYGVPSPQQVPEIRARTKSTMLERYGGELLASPEIKSKSEATNLERYGVAFPGGTPEVQAKVKATNMKRYGVPHTCMDPDIRHRQLETMVANYGSHYFASDKGKEEIRKVLLEKYGVEHSAQIEGFWEKALETFQRNHPGVAFPGMLARPKFGMNLLETTVFNLAPPKYLLYTGDGSWWRRLPLLGHYKNPDFIVPGPDPAKPKKGVTKVVEAFGDYWHSRMFTGKASFAHEQELIEAFVEIGIECLVIWESEVKSDPEAVRTRLASFLLE